MLLEGKNLSDLCFDEENTYSYQKERNQLPLCREIMTQPKPPR